MKRTLWMVFCICMLMMSWEGQLTSANVLDNGPIPQESIRLRIIANSDSFQDQWLKREVRDALIAQMETWAKDIDSFEDAEKVVAANLPIMQQVVDQTIRDRGFSYKAVVDFGQVPFPTKLYGSYVYPAGDYTALRVQIGEAKGQNWWCVLFPPLCFIDMSNGDAVQAATQEQAQTNGIIEPDGTEQAKADVLESEAQPAEEAAAAAEGRMREGWQEWRQMRLEERQVGDKAAAEAEVERDVIATDSEQTAPEQQLEPIAPAAAPAPEIQVRFYLLEKLESLFS
ncbi:stage II sporulation protein R [Brevibacillus brevis]|uniref:Stage II sporulation protein R n=1 Tax=Brevibacillus brevis TaxID=1393 RepID=A0ABY9T4W6_BREBE|nr:stage II sporulation protein R [Brevibacillus brevis]WNC14549.1 stage II sporulation protein R [Brevibacillus brevis]